MRKVGDKKFAIGIRQAHVHELNFDHEFRNPDKSERSRVGGRVC